MSRKDLRVEYTILCTKIKEVEAREMAACYASARSEAHEDMNILWVTRQNLEDKRSAILRQINKPSLIKRLRKVVRM